MSRVRSLFVITSIVAMTFSTVFPVLISQPITTYAAATSVQWGKTTVSNPASVRYFDVATDSNNNSYAVGYLFNTNGTYDFGNGVTASPVTSQSTALMVKYNSSGTPQWAVVPTVPTNNIYTSFDSIAIDSSDNLYVGMSLDGSTANRQINIGGGSIQVPISHCSSGDILTKAALFKFNSDGGFQWGSTPASACDITYVYHSVAVSANGVYSVGYGSKDYALDLGDGITLSGPAGEHGGPETTHGIVTKYNTSGTAVAAMNTSSADNIPTYFFGITANSAGVFVSGYVGNSATGFGNGVSVTGSNATGSALLVKYNSSLVAQWASTTVSGSPYARAYAADLDSAGNIYVAVTPQEAGTYDFGNSVTMSTEMFMVGAVVKYSSSGVAQWARIMTSTADPDSIWAEMNDIKVSPSDQVFVVGEEGIDATYDFDNGITTTTLGAQNDNAFIVQYDTDGNAIWAKTADTGGDGSDYYSLSIDTEGNVVALGDIWGSTGIDFGNGVVVSSGGAGLMNPLIVKYDFDRPSFQNIPGDGVINVTEGQTITSNPYQLQVKPTDNSGISQVNFYVDGNLICSATEPDGDGVFDCNWDTSQYHSVVSVIAYDDSANHNQSNTITRETTVSLGSSPGNENIPAGEAGVTSSSNSVLPETGSD